MTGKDWERLRTPVFFKGSRSPVVSQSRGLAVSQSRGLVVSLARHPVILSHSQSFSVFLSKSRASQQSRAPQPYLLQPAKQKKSEPPKREAPISILRDHYIIAVVDVPVYLTPVAVTVRFTVTV